MAVYGRAESQNLSICSFLFQWRLSSIKGRLPLKVVFHPRLSSIEGRLLSKVVIHKRLSSIGVIPCQTIRKKLQRQKNVFFGLISVTYILNSQKMPFISVLLGLVLNFGQILSFSAFGMFFPYLSIFFGVNDQQPILFDPWAGIEPIQVILTRFLPKNWNFLIFGHFEHFQFFGSGN